MINIPYKRSYIIVLQIEAAEDYLKNNSQSLVTRTNNGYTDIKQLTKYNDSLWPACVISLSSNTFTIGGINTTYKENFLYSQYLQ